MQILGLRTSKGAGLADRRRGAGVFAAAVLVVAACCLPAGCAKEPWAGPEPEPGRQERLLTAMQQAVEGYEPTRTLEVAGPRGRWEHVEDALYWAIAEKGVEMGLLQTRRFDWGYIFELKTVEGWPVTLTVRRSDDPERVYEAEAEVGRFPDLPQRRARAERLLEAFDAMMTSFGRKRRLQ